MIERKQVKCPTCKGLGRVKPYFTDIDKRGVGTWQCAQCKGACEVYESDRDFIARLQSIIEQQEVSIKAYKRLAKRWIKVAYAIALWAVRYSQCRPCDGDCRDGCLKDQIAHRIKAAKKAVEGEEG